MKKMISTFLIIAFVFNFHSCDADSENDTGTEGTVEVPEAPLEVGYGLAIGNFDLETLAYAKSVGIDHVEASGMGLFLDGDVNFKLSDEEIRVILQQAKQDADEAGINIWSVHMPFGQNIDISTRNEEARKKVVAAQRKLVEFLEILDPEIILFHPSYYLGLNERDTRKSQMIKSAIELNEAVMEIDATMVLENMLGPELLASGGRERPLMRTVEETKEIFNRLPQSIGLAVDTNHIINPEQLIRAMGDRLETVHIADGTGRAENHWFPCSGEGQNNWPDIIAALEEVGYDGPFMYETSVSDVQDYRECYEQLYERYSRIN